MRGMTEEESHALDVLDKALRSSSKIIAQGYTPEEIEQLKQQERAAERAAIVVWLEERAEYTGVSAYNYIAGCIKRGEHIQPATDTNEVPK